MKISIKIEPSPKKFGIGIPDLNFLILGTQNTKHKSCLKNTSHITRPAAEDLSKLKLHNDTLRAACSCGPVPCSLYM